MSGLEGGKAWGWKEKTLWVIAVTTWGVLGSMLDSVLGGLLQATVVDKRSGKVVEGIGGRKVRSPLLLFIHLTFTKWIAYHARICRFLSTLVKYRAVFWERFLFENPANCEWWKILLIP